MCGSRLEEWEDDPDAFVAYTYRCPGCRRLEGARADIPTGEKGLQTVLRRPSAKERAEGLPY